MAKQFNTLILRKKNYEAAVWPQMLGQGGSEVPRNKIPLSYVQHKQEVSTKERDEVDRNACKKPHERTSTCVTLEDDIGTTD